MFSVLFTVLHFSLYHLFFILKLIFMCNTKDTGKLLQCSVYFPLEHISCWCRTEWYSCISLSIRKACKCCLILRFFILPQAVITKAGTNKCKIMQECDFGEYIISSGTPVHWPDGFLVKSCGVKAQPYFSIGSMYWHKGLLYI